MKKAVIWAMAAMMILGSLKALATDIDMTGGKLDAAEAEEALLEADIQAENTEGKIAAAELQTAMASIRTQIDAIYAMQDELSALEDSQGMIKKLGMIADLEEQKLRAIDDSLNVALAKKANASLAKRIQVLRQEVNVVLGQ
ncbi:hypothetical protein [Bdellovibrio sp. HCB2-146]|uniref:hypothetical protein n=1 Tax=Bdellovibrio sp. HCB2-146 TaxID=3394362 RepID=UPI0039BC39DC